MARSFNGTNSRIHVSSAVLSATPYTMACWFRTTNMTQLGTLISMTKSTSTTNYAGLFFRGDIAGDPIDILIEGKSGQGSARSTTGCTSGQWHHACGVFNSSTSRTVYIDGGSSATNTNSVTPSLDRTEVGAWRSSLWFSGDIAEVGVWDIDLTAAEVASLAKGVSPALVRPQSLVTYLPLIRDVIDVRAANGFTDVNTTAANHPRVYR